MRVEFEIWLKDMLSGGVRKMGVTAQSVFGGIGRSVDDTKKRIDELTKKRNISLDYKEITAANKEIEKLRNHLNGIENLGSGGGGRRGGIRNIAAGVMLGGMAMTGIGMATNAAVGGVKSVFNSGLEGGGQKSQFEVMAGEKAGDKLFGDLTKYVNDSVFGKSLYQDANTLMGFGEKVENVMDDMKMLGDVSRGNAQKMSSLSLAFGQTEAAGKLTGQDQLQYIAAGFNPLQEISRTTGKSMGVLKDEMSEGKISFDMVREAFRTATSEGGRFHGMLEKMGKTFFGKKDAMIGNIEGAVMGLGMKLDPLWNKMLDRLKPLVDKLPALFDRMVPIIEKVYGRFEEMIPSLSAFGRGVVDLLQPIGELVMSDGMVSFAKTMVELAGSMTKVLKPAVEGVSKSLEVLLGVVEPLVSAIKGAYDWIESHIPMGKSKQENKERFERLADAAFNNLVYKEERVDKLGGNLPKAPKSMFAPVSADKPRSVAATDTDAIVGGGRKVVNINFRNFIEHLKIESASTGEGFAQTEQQLKEMWVRLLRSAEGAIG
jgi:tape measure domain-containing protein